MTDREIYEELQGPLMRFAASLVGPQNAGDLVSEAVVATLGNRPNVYRTLTSLEYPQAYLMKAVLNRARSWGRRAQTERQALARIDAPTPGADPADAILVDLSRTVARLPVRQRAAIHLVYWEDLTPTEAAALLGIRPATLRRYLHLARRRLRGYLDE